MQSIDAPTLQQMMQRQEKFVLIDVREPVEHEQFNIGGNLIPMNQVMEQAATIPNNKPVIFYCQKGIRSALVIQRLEQRFHFQNLVNLSGGIDAWRKQMPDAAGHADAATNPQTQP